MNRESVARMDTAASPRSLEKERRIVQAQHAVLRDLLGRTRRTASEVLAAREPIAALVDQISTLRDFLDVHLRDEESFLIPVLQGAGDWGQLRLSCLQAEHAHQRAVMAVLSGDAARRAPKELARRTLLLAADLLSDLEQEERELLSPTLPSDVQNAKQNIA